MGDKIYVFYYTQKYEGAYPNGDESKTEYGWHVDGVIMATRKISVVYNANCLNDFANIPAGYQMDKNVNPDSNGKYTSAQFTAGVSGAPSGTVGNTPTRKGYTFLYWNTQADGLGETYQQGDEVTTDRNITLYAIWGSNENGSLKITKEVKPSGDSAADTKYKIRVSLPGSLNDDRASYTAKVYDKSGTLQETKTVTFTNSDGSAVQPETFELQDGWYVIIEGIRDGEGYEVGEIEVPGNYRVTYKDANGASFKNNKAIGRIMAGETMEVIVVNSPRIVKSSVDTGAIPAEGAAAVAAMLIAFGAAYVCARRRYR